MPGSCSYPFGNISLDDKVVIVNILEDAKENGYSSGYNSGYDSGKSDSISNIAKNMLKKNMSIEDISDVTGLTLEEINNLRENI